MISIKELNIFAILFVPMKYEEDSSRKAVVIQNTKHEDKIKRMINKNKWTEVKANK